MGTIVQRNVNILIEYFVEFKFSNQGLIRVYNPKYMTPRERI